MAKKPEAKLENIKVAFKCNKTGLGAVAEVTEDAFSASSSPCDLCGSHGELELTVQCPHCSKFKKDGALKKAVYHYITMREW